MKFKILLLSFFINSFSDFSYNKDLFLVSPTESFEITQDIKNIAFNINQHLSFSKFFDTSNIVNTPWIQTELKKDRTHSTQKALTKDNHIIEFSYFNRNSDTLILIGPGFTNCKEKMAPFIHMFSDYDLGILNFRGHGYCNKISLNPSYKLFGIKTDTSLGHKEELDVFAVLNKIKKQKKYKKVIGLGICYGAFIFAKAQGIAKEQNEKLFDKLILDGCWLSLNNFINKIYSDPMLILNPQHGGASNWIKNIFKNKKIQSSAQWTLSKLLHYDHNIDLRNYLYNIEIPTLMFYGKNDLTISREEFEEIYTNLGTHQKIAIITSNPHVHNHLRSKEFYKLACDKFIENDIEDLSGCLKNPHTLKDKLTMNLNLQLDKPQNDLFKPIKIEKPKSNKKLWLGIAGALTLGSIFAIQKIKN